MRARLIACTLLLAAAACEAKAPPPTETAVATQPTEVTAPVQPAMAGPPSVEDTINWEQARADRAASPAAANATVSVQSVGNTPAGPPSVPVLLPSGIVLPQNARPPAVVATEDGYFANYQMPKWDAVVNGSKRAYVTGAASNQQPEGAMSFTTSDASAQMAFTRYGADYLIEFECRQMDGQSSCITESEAKAFADSLFVAQTQ